MANNSTNFSKWYMDQQIPKYTYKISHIHYFSDLTKGYQRTSFSDKHT